MPEAKKILYDVNTGTDVELPSEGKLTIGRPHTNDIPVPIHPERGKKKGGEIFRSPLIRRAMMEISRHHADLYVKGGGVEIEDAGSKHGTYVTHEGKERKLGTGERYRLENGDMVRMGQWKVQFLEEPGDVREVEKKKLGTYQIREKALV